MPGYSEIPPDTVHRWISTGEALPGTWWTCASPRNWPRPASEMLFTCRCRRSNTGRIPTDSGKKVVFICAQGLRSEQVGQYMVAQGLLAEAYNLAGGLIAWAEAGLPLDPGA